MGTLHVLYCAASTFSMIGMLITAHVLPVTIRLMMAISVDYTTTGGDRK